MADDLARRNPSTSNGKMLCHCSIGAHVVSHYVSTYGSIHRLRRFKVH
jgi:hypothetical protein